VRENFHLHVVSAIARFDTCELLFFTAHANARRNTKNTAREVVYLGFLPGVIIFWINVRYTVD
jgi:hypothetical protein